MEIIVFQLPFLVKYDILTDTGNQKRGGLPSSEGSVTLQTKERRVADDYI